MFGACSFVLFTSRTLLYGSVGPSWLYFWLMIYLWPVMVFNVDNAQLCCKSSADAYLMITIVLSEDLYDEGH